MQILDAALASRCCRATWPSSCTTPLASRWTCRPTSAASAVLTVDEAGFHAAMDKQKAQGRAAGKFKMDRALEYSGDGNDFVGYERLTETAQIVALYADGTGVSELKAGQNGVVVLDTTPFYAESGGQVGDEGAIFCDSALFEVADTQKIKADVFGHHGTLKTGALKVGDEVTAHVNAGLRAATMRNHSVTHLMHKALREVLGDACAAKGLAGERRAHPL